MPEQTSTKSNPTSQAVWYAARTLLSDVGTSVVIGFIIGMFFGAAGYTAADLADSFLMPIIGLIISLYMSYVLYKRYSQHSYALVSLLGFAVVLGSIQIYSEFLRSAEYVFTQNAIFIVAQVLVYFLGWYIAKSTSKNIYIPPNPWFVGAGILGAVVVLLSLVGFVGALNS